MKLDKYVFGEGNGENNSVKDTAGWKKRLMRINNQELTLSYKPEIEPFVKRPEENNSSSLENQDYQVSNEMVVTQEYEFDKSSIEIEPGISIMIPSKGGAVTQRKEAGGDSVVFFLPGGKIKINPSNAQVMEKQEFDLAMMHLISIGHT